MATKAKKTPETAGVTFRSVPEQRERSTTLATIELLRTLDVPAGQAVVLATHSTHKSALSTASRLRRKHTDLEFFAIDQEVLARPKAAAVATITPKVVAVAD